MDGLDFAEVLSHLMQRLGEPAAVAVGGVDAESPAVVAELRGTLRFVDRDLTADLPDLDPVHAPVVFGFEEHPCTFIVDALDFSRAHARGAHLEMQFGSVAIEVRPIEDE